MESFTYSKAGQNLSRVLDIALKRGLVEVRRRDGTTFVIRPGKKTPSKSPLNVKGIRVKGIGRQEILAAVREGRRAF